MFALESLRDEPDFLALEAIIQADVQAQFEQLQAMEQTGDIPPLAH